ncbi:MAG: histidinol dehydrogenase, partial [Alteraurantiacibacter sp.]|nr:histidinol dehydrogenase [Alteraurantiacibacter sp.]
MQLLCTREPDFEKRFARIVNDRRESEKDVAGVVQSILARVKAEGDAALADLTRRYDGFDPEADGWQIDRDACKAAFDNLDPALRDALETAAQRIRAYHQAQLPEDRDYTDAAGVRLGARWNPCLLYTS